MDLITYVEDLSLMNSEGASIDPSSDLGKLFTVDDDGALTFNVAKIPVKYSGDKSLCLVRGVARETLALSTSIQVLGECIDGEYVFDSLEKQAIYESVYDTKPRMIDDGDGGTFEYTPPYKVGVFS